jgi:hypothetical protein
MSFNERRPSDGEPVLIEVVEVYLNDYLEEVIDSLSVMMDEYGEGYEDLYLAPNHTDGEASSVYKLYGTPIYE